jgi:hypothetical protein
MNREEQQLLDRQNRVFGVLDVATKPAQWLIGGFEVLLALVAGALFLICAPIYYFVEYGAGAVTGNMVYWSILTCFAIVLLYQKPRYTTYTSLGSLLFIGLWINTHHKLIVGPNVYLVRDHAAEMAHLPSPEVLFFCIVAFGYFLLFWGWFKERIKERQSEQNMRRRCGVSNCVDKRVREVNQLPLPD